MRHLQGPGTRTEKRRVQRQRRPAAVLLVGATIVWVAGCVYDSGKRCGERQTMDARGVERCVCDGNSAWSQSGCVPCGTHEVASALGCVCETGYGRTDATAACAPCGANEITNAFGACECAKGYSRPSAGEACVLAPAGQGVACDSSPGSCADPTYNYCRLVTAAQGYCTTQNCTNSADCLGGYECDLSASPSYCRRPPVGLLTPCASNADCAGTEATYCDIYYSKACLVQGCSLSPDNCFTGFQCCDLSKYGVAQPLCVVQGGCTT
jgi:hypothetical protein